MYDRLPLLLALEPVGRGPSSGMQHAARISSTYGGMEIGKAFDNANFAVAMPWDGASNSAIAGVVDGLIAGKAVYR